jgi:predicted PurR-regulated permease PerM
MAARPRKKQVSSTTSPEQEAAGEMQWDSLFASLGRFEIVLLVGGMLLLLVLIYTIHEILSPFLVLGAMLFLLFPLRRYVLARNMMWLAVILFAVWFLNAVFTILTPFIIALVFAYILNPVVDLFERWNVARWISALVLILLFVTGIALVIFFILPIAVTQLSGVLNTLAKLTDDFRNTFWSSNLIRVLERYGISSDELRNSFANQLTPRFEDILKGLVGAAGTLLSSVSSFITQVFYIFLIPFLTFYFLTDFPTITHRFLMLIPHRSRGRVAEYMSRANDLIGHYLRGALTVALLQGILVAVLFSIIGIKYALLLGLLAGVCDLIPYFGLLSISVLSAIVAVFSDPPVLPKLAFAVGSIGLLHITEVVFLSPKIVGSKVGLHPLLMILSLLIFMYFLGFVGLLIAVPTTALIILFVREWEARKRGIIPGSRNVHS